MREKDMRLRMRVRWLIVAVVLTLGGIGVPTAGAHEGPHKATDATTPDGAVGIGDGVFLSGGRITPPAGEAPRTLDAYHAAVFVQSWLAAAFYGGADIVRDPPPELPVYRVDSTGDWAGSTGTVTVYYATDGTTPYIAFPGLVVWTDESEVPAPSNWFVAPPRVIEAFNGTADLVPSLGVETATSVATTVPADGAAGPASPADVAEDQTTNPWPWVLVGATALAAAAGALWLRRRARAS
jgi:hypothetical protein